MTQAEATSSAETKIRQGIEERRREERRGEGASKLDVNDNEGSAAMAEGEELWRRGCGDDDVALSMMPTTLAHGEG